MNITTLSKPLKDISCELLVVRLFEDAKALEKNIRELDEAIGRQITAALKSEAFRGESGETLVLAPTTNIAPKRVLLLGMGKKKEYTLAILRSAMAAIAQATQRLKARHLAIAILQTRPKKANPATTRQALMDSVILSHYQFTRYKNYEPGKKPVSLEELTLVFSAKTGQAAAKKDYERAAEIAEAVVSARDLGNHPGNVATPSHLATHALDLAKQFPKSLKVQVLSKKEIQKEKMGAMLAVAQGSDEEPKFIILKYGAKKSAPTVVLVGKGITFDSGGISLKPGDKMEEMKFDMAGAAAVLGVIQAAAATKLPLNLVGLIPATENLPSGKAIKPGDIVRARSGKTIEIINTDAEGRLVLSDALDFAKQYQPDLVIDFATLTGAIVVALGDTLTGAFTNTDKLIPQLQKSAQATGEKVWPMPLEKSYDEFIKSDAADLRNIGTTRFADSINAANFLKNFVGYPWIHLDIAGTAWATRPKPYEPKGATGAGVRLIMEFLQNFKPR